MAPWPFRKRRFEQLRLKGTTEGPLVKVARGVAEFVSYASITGVMIIVAGTPAVLVVAVALIFMPLPYDPPLDVVPGSAWVWHQFTAWLAFGGVMLTTGTWASHRAWRWLGGGVPRPRLKPRGRYALGFACLGLLGLGLYLAVPSLEDKKVEPLLSKAINPGRVCRQDPDLPPPISGKGLELYDTNGTGDPDVAVDGSAEEDRFGVLIDTAENGLWPSIGYCEDGEFHSDP